MTGAPSWEAWLTGRRFHYGIVALADSRWGEGELGDELERHPAPGGAHSGDRSGRPRSGGENPRPARSGDLGVGRLEFRSRGDKHGGTHEGRRLRQADPRPKHHRPARPDHAFAQARGGRGRSRSRRRVRSRSGIAARRGAGRRGDGGLDGSGARHRCGPQGPRHGCRQRGFDLRRRACGAPTR